MFYGSIELDKDGASDALAVSESRPGISFIYFGLGPLIWSI